MATALNTLTQHSHSDSDTSVNACPRAGTGLVMPRNGPGRDSRRCPWLLSQYVEHVYLTDTTRSGGRRAT